jgi:HD-GYP domain-containing protein (c-di-GMP phosphodiesterase class II)
MQKIAVKDLTPGMVAAKSIYNADGRMLLAEGATFTKHYIKRLQEIGVWVVYIQNPLAASIDVPDILAEETRVKAISTVKEAFEGFRNTKKIDMGQFKQLTESIVDEVIRNPNAVFHLNDIRMYDDYTFAHSVNVCVLAVLVGASLQYTPRQLMELGVGAVLHDVGKMAVEKQILNKPGHLSESEMDLMRRHPEWGFEILRKYSAQLSWLSIHVAFQHQEKFDGSGYPRGLKGTEIHEYARITAIADVYDALMSDRPYRPALSASMAYEFLVSGSGTHFDPDILGEFLRHIALYPVGSMVKLNTGDIGIVTQVFPGLQTRPTVRLLVDAADALYESEAEIDLSIELTVFVDQVLPESDVAALVRRIGNSPLTRRYGVG